MLSQAINPVKQCIGHTLKEKIVRRMAKKSAKGQRDVIILDVRLFYVSLETHNFPVKKKSPHLVQMLMSGLRHKVNIQKS